MAEGEDLAWSGKRMSGACSGEGTRLRITCDKGGDDDSGTWDLPPPFTSACSLTLMATRLTRFRLFPTVRSSTRINPKARYVEATYALPKPNKRPPQREKKGPTSARRQSHATRGLGRSLSRGVDSTQFPSQNPKPCGKNLRNSPPPFCFLLPWLSSQNSANSFPAVMASFNTAGAANHNPNKSLEVRRALDTPLRFTGTFLRGSI